VIVETSVIY